MRFMGETSFERVGEADSFALPNHPRVKTHDLSETWGTFTQSAISASIFHAFSSLSATAARAAAKRGR
jgi:hypothetical protein